MKPRIALYLVLVAVAAAAAWLFLLKTDTVELADLPVGAVVAPAPTTESHGGAPHVPTRDVATSSAAPVLRFVVGRGVKSPVSGVKIYRYESTMSSVALSDTCDGVSDRDGRVRVAALVQQHVTSVVAVQDGYASIRVDLPSDGETEVTMRAGVGLAVKAQSATGKPIRGCAVVVSDTQYWQPPLVSSAVSGVAGIGGSVWGGVTGDDGTVNVEGMPAGKYRVHVFAESWCPVEAMYCGGADVQIPSNEVTVVCTPVFAAIAAVQGDVSWHSYQANARRRRVSCEIDKLVRQRLERTFDTNLCAVIVGEYGASEGDDVGAATFRVQCADGRYYEEDVKFVLAGRAKPQLLAKHEMREMRQVRVLFPYCANLDTRVSLFNGREWYVAKIGQEMSVPVGEYEIAGDHYTIMGSHLWKPRSVVVEEGDSCLDVALKTNVEYGLVRILPGYRFDAQEEPIFLQCVGKFGSLAFTPKWSNRRSGWVFLSPAGKLRIEASMLDAERVRKDIEVVTDQIVECRLPPLQRR
ncbi:MAG: hypothetical protein KDC95_00410 [Planctomycetes bacterium]|nr:hypothetical protein [Planctomycetota bacterium]